MQLGTHAQAANRYPSIYATPAKSAKQKKPDQGFESWLFAAAQAGIAGELEKVEKLPIWKLFEILDYMIKQQQQ